MRRLICSAILCAAAFWPGERAQGQSFPVSGRPINILYGFPAGTPGDVDLRLVALGLTPLESDPAEMQAASERDIRHWGEVVRRAGLRREQPSPRALGPKNSFR